MTERIELKNLSSKGEALLPSPKPLRKPPLKILKTNISVCSSHV